MRAGVRLATVAAGAAVLLVAGYSGVAHASACSSRKVTHLRWSRGPGAPAGLLRWRAPAHLPAEAGYRVWRSGALIGVARRRRAPIHVTPRHTYTFTVRVENLVTGHISACSASLTRTINYYRPGMAGHLVAAKPTETSVFLAWRPARRGDGHMAGYRVYRNGEVRAADAAHALHRPSPLRGHGLPVLRARGRHERHPGASLADRPPDDAHPAADNGERDGVHPRVRRRELRRPAAPLHAHRHDLPDVLQLHAHGRDHRRRRPAGHRVVAGARHQRRAALQLPEPGRAQGDPDELRRSSST